MALIVLLTTSPLLSSVHLQHCKACLHKDGFKKMKLMYKDIFCCSRRSPQSSPKADLWDFTVPSSQGTMLSILYLQISLCHVDEYNTYAVSFLVHLPEGGREKRKRFPPNGPAENVFTMGDTT